jgi:hypothetical protein
MNLPDPSGNAIFDPNAVGQRIAYLAHAVVGHFSHVDRNHPSVRFDTLAINKLQDVAHAWHGAEAMDPETFRQRFFDPMTSDATVENLRKAIQNAADARTYDQLGHASRDLATTMAAVGLDRWPALLNKMSTRATAAKVN